jgi:hypothetical protein
MPEKGEIDREKQRYWLDVIADFEKSGLSGSRKRPRYARDHSPQRYHYPSGDPILAVNCHTNSGVNVMFSLSSSVRIFVCTRTADMRRSFNGLVALVKSHFHGDPYSGIT